MHMDKKWIAISLTILISICSYSAMMANIIIINDEIELDQDEFYLSESSYGNFTINNTIVDDISFPNSWYDICIDTDSSGNVHILFKSNYTTITHATKIGNQWVTQDLNITVLASSFDMAIDSNDNIHISWENYTDYDLMYTTNASGEWITTSVDTSGRKGYANSIAVDSQNKPHIMYVTESYNGWYEDYSLHLRYATLSEEGNWQKETIAFPTVRRDDSTERGGVYETDIQIDSQDKVHSTYTVYDSAMYEGLWYASGNRGDWNKVKIQGSTNFWSPSIALDSNDEAHVSYESSSEKIIYAHQGVNDTWNKSTVDNSSSFSDSSIVMDINDRPHIVYIDTDADDLKYATHSATSWDVNRISQEMDYSTTTALVLAENGGLHISLLNDSGSPYHTQIMHSDADLDGITVLMDQCPNEGNPNYDSDRDGCIDDGDGDGIYDYLDQCPEVDSTGFDTDNDGCIDDSDGDGVGDDLDLFPDDSTETNDTDSDGVGDNSDSCEGHDDSIDIDEDGIVDGCDDLLDNDGDGVGNQDDAFPEDSTETNDTDDDGVGDNTDSDIDGDYAPNDVDDFPYDELRTKDTDGDGLADFTLGPVEGMLIDFEDGYLNDVDIHCAADFEGLCMPDYSPWVLTNDSINGEYSLEQQLWASDTGHFSISFSSKADDVVTLEIYITSIIIEQQCIPIFLDGVAVDYGCVTEGFGYYDNISINVSEGEHELKFYGTILGSGNQVDNIQLPDYVISENEDTDDDNDGWLDIMETSFSEDSPCYSDPLDPNENPKSNIQQTMYLGASPTNYMLDEGNCQIYYDSDNDGIVDYYSSFEGYVSVDRCPEEFGYDVGEWVENETTGKSEFNMDNWGCPLEQEDEKSSKEEVKSFYEETSFQAIGIGAGVLLVLIVVFFVRRRDNQNEDLTIESEDDLQDDNTLVENNEATSIFADTPPDEATGLLNDDGYYWIEWPIASGKWYYRVPDQNTWNYYEK